MEKILSLSKSLNIAYDQLFFRYNAVQLIRNCGINTSSNVFEILETFVSEFQEKRGHKPATPFLRELRKILETEGQQGELFSLFII